MYDSVDSELLKVLFLEGYPFRGHLEYCEQPRTPGRVGMLWKALVQRKEKGAALKKLRKSCGWEGASIFVLRQPGFFFVGIKYHSE